MTLLSCTKFGVKGYLFNDDTFNYNCGQAKVAVNEFQEAEEALLLIQDASFKADYTYIIHLVKCCKI